jgi:hypothetical protein
MRTYTHTHGYECKDVKKQKHANMRSCLTEAQDMLKTHTGLHDDGADRRLGRVSTDDSHQHW